MFILRNETYPEKNGYKPGMTISVLDRTDNKLRYGIIADREIWLCSDVMAVIDLESGRVLKIPMDDQTIKLLPDATLLPDRTGTDLRNEREGAEKCIYAATFTSHGTKTLLFETEKLTQNSIDRLQRIMAKHANDLPEDVDVRTRLRRILATAEKELGIQTKEIKTQHTFEPDYI